MSDPVLSKLENLIQQKDIESQLINIIGVDPKSNLTLYNNVTDLIKVLTADRNGDGKFSIDDLKLLGKDPSSIIDLCTSLVFTLGQIPSFVRNKSGKDWEESIMSLLTWIFLVQVPKATGSQLSSDEKKQILDVCYDIYEVISKLQIVTNLVHKVKAYFQSKGCCGGPQPDPSQMQANVAQSHLNIAVTVQANKDQLDNAPKVTPNVVLKSKSQ